MSGKMLVVTLAKTKAVLAAVTRQQAGVPPIEDLVGDGLVVRKRNNSSSMKLPVRELEVKEVDYKADVFNDPRAHVVDGSVANTVTYRIDSVGNTAGTVTVVLETDTNGNVPAGKMVIVVVDAGAEKDPVVLTKATELNVKTITFEVSGVPPGSHLVLASAEGYTSTLEVEAFT